jgi:hypothetical protein
MGTLTMQRTVEMKACIQLALLVKSREGALFDCGIDGKLGNVGEAAQADQTKDQRERLDCAQRTQALTDSAMTGAMRLGLSVQREIELERDRIPDPTIALNRLKIKGSSTCLRRCSTRL